MSKQFVSFLLTYEILFVGKRNLRAVFISLPNLGYALSQVILSLVVRLFGQDRLPSPNAIPTM